MQTLEQHIETPSFFNGPTLNPSSYMMHKKAGSGIGGAGLQIVSSVKNKYPQGEKEEEQIVRSKDTNQMFETRTAKPMITQARNNAEAVEGGGVNSIVPPANARSSSVIHSQRQNIQQQQRIEEPGNIVNRYRKRIRRDAEDKKIEIEESLRRKDARQASERLASHARRLTRRA